ncbi:GNAT family N-acetyltransferase [Nocardia sp. alder85J]|uniref:GNAT family N-acetyltransferase n=1 Tax=Nocardia sp. alder85J TaxID=2862949 RepID=UPI001CD2743B|nr:GNAT family N-acetyltransferase [Nocardia sp. alder85J]MCX4092235.1 GNAT family N-acetyltransferase [Nocardia sp. alder85J]
MIRPATAADVPALVGLVHDLADYEKAREQCTLTEQQLHTALFGPTAALYAHVAVDDSSDAVLGCAIWFLNFSTWDGVHGIYLEDLYVRPEARGSGLGKALLVELARVAVARGYSRVAWSVLDWNTPSIDFYRAIGAQPQQEWLGYRLSGAALTRLADA